FLLSQLIEGLLMLRGFGKRLGPAGRVVGEFLEDVLLLPSQLTSLGSHGAEVLGDLIRAILAHLVVEVLELTLGASAGGDGLGDAALASGLLGALDVLAGLLQLAPLLGHARLVLGTIHALAEFIDIGEDLLFFLLKPFEAPLQLLA